MLYFEKLEHRTKHEPSPKTSATSGARDNRANPYEQVDESRHGRSEEPSEARQEADVQGMNVSLCKVIFILVPSLYE